MKKLLLLLLLPCVFKAQNLPISGLPTATTLVGTEVLPIVQGGATKKATVTQIRGSAATITLTGAGSTSVLGTNPYTITSSGGGASLPTGQIGYGTGSGITSTSVVTYSNNIVSAPNFSTTGNISIGRANPDRPFEVFSNSGIATMQAYTSFSTSYAALYAQGSNPSNYAGLQMTSPNFTQTPLIKGDCPYFIGAGVTQGIVNRNASGNIQLIIDGNNATDVKLEVDANTVSVVNANLYCQGTTSLSNALNINRLTDASVVALNIFSGSSGTSAYQLTTDQPNTKIIENGRNSYNFEWQLNDVAKASLTSAGFNVVNGFTASSVVIPSFTTAGQAVITTSTGALSFTTFPSSGGGATLTAGQVAVGNGTAGITGSSDFNYNSSRLGLGVAITSVTPAKMSIDVTTIETALDVKNVQSSGNVNGIKTEAYSGSGLAYGGQFTGSSNNESYGASFTGLGSNDFESFGTKTTGGYFAAVYANDKAAIQLVDGTEGAGKLLYSKDANGRCNFAPNMTYTNDVLTIPKAAVTNTLIIGSAPNYTDTGTFLQMTSGTNSYLQSIITNTNSGSAASANYIVSNNLGTATTFYGEFGMNSSTFTGTAAYMRPNAVYVVSQSSDLSLCTASANAIHISANGSVNDAITISSANAVQINSALTVTNTALFSGTSNTVTAKTAMGGNFVPTANIHLGAGTTAATTAPLKFTSGALMTTAEVGAIEFLTDKFYGTISTSTLRTEFTLNNVALTSGRVPFSTTNGRLTDLAAFTYATNRLSPTYITLAAGAAAAGSAPVVLTTGTSLTTPIAGALEYTSPQLFFTNGTGTPIRQQIPLIQNSRVTSAFNATSNTTLVNITGLTANVAAAGVYSFRAVLYTTSDAAAGVKFAIGGTATATSIIYEGLATNAGVITQTRGAALAATVGAVTAVTAAYVVIEGSIVVNAAGTITVQFAQNVSNAVSSSVLVGSTFQVQQTL